MISSSSMRHGVLTPSGARFEYVEQEATTTHEPELTNYIANPNYATSRSKSSFNSTALNYAIGEAGQTLPLGSKISLHKNSTAKSGLNQTIQNHDPDLNIRITANQSYVSSAMQRSKMITARSKRDPFPTFNVTAQYSPSRNMLRGGDIRFASRPQSGTRNAMFNRTVSLNKSFNLRSGKNGELNTNVRPTGRRNLLQSNSRSSYAQRAIARLDQMRGPPLTLASTKTASRNLLLRKETESDFERAEEDSKEKQTLNPRKLSKESQLIKSGSDLLNNTFTSSNILVEPYIASSPDITSITNPIIDKRLNTTDIGSQGEVKKTSEPEYASSKKVLTTMENKGFHESGEQSQFIHGSSIDEGPTSPRGANWGEQSQDRSSKIHSPISPIIGEMQKKSPKTTRPGSQLKGHDKAKLKKIDPRNSRELYPKAFLQLELTYDHGDADWNSTLTTDQSGRIREEVRDSFTPASAHFKLRPESTKHRAVQRHLMPQLVEDQFSSTSRQSLFMPTSKKPQSTKVINYKSCTAKHMLRVNTFDQKVWAPSLEGYITIESKYRPLIMYRNLTEQEATTVEGYVQGQKAPIFTPSYKPSPQTSPEPVPLSPQLKRVTTSVLSKHRNQTRGSVNPSSLSKTSSKKGPAQRAGTLNPKEVEQQLQQYNPSLMASGIREEPPRAKSVNTQTHNSINPSYDNNASAFISGSSSTPHPAMLVGIDNVHDSSLLTSKLFKSIHSNEHRNLDEQMESEERAELRKQRPESKLNISHDPYESVDYSQTAQNNLPPKGLASSHLELEDSEKKKEQDKMYKKQQESNVSLQSSIAPNSNYFPGSGLREDIVSSKNSQNQAQLTGFTFEVEVKKTKEAPQKKKSVKSSFSKEGSNKEQNVGDDQKQQVAKTPKKRKPGKKRSFSKKQRGTKMVKMQEYRIQTPQDALNRSISPFNTNPSCQEEGNRATSTSPLGISAGGGNMMVYRGKVPLAFGSKLNSPPQGSDRQRQQTPDLNLDIFQDMKTTLMQTGTFHSPGLQEEENLEQNDSQFRSLEQNQMSLRDSLDLGIQGKKISLSPPKQTQSKINISNEQLQLARGSATPEKLYSQSARTSPVRDIETPLRNQTPVKKSIMSKYQQKMISSASPKLIKGLSGSSPQGRGSSKLDKSIYRSQITEFNSNVSSILEAAKQRDLQVQSAVESIKEKKGETQQFLSKITEMQQLLTQESGNYSPVLQRRLSPLKLIGESSPGILSRGEQIELDSCEKQSPMKTPISDAHFTLAPSLLYDNEILKNEVSSGNYQQMLAIGEEILKKGITQLKNSQSAPVSPPTQFRSGLSSAHHQKQKSLKVPLSLSSVQLVPVEELENQNLQVAQLTKTERESITIKKLLSSLDYKSVDLNKNRGQKGEELRKQRIPPQKKRPFIGSKNQPAPVPPHQLSPYSSKHGRITRRSAGTWCQIPQKILDIARSTPKKNLWNFFSLGSDDWGQILKKDTEESERLEDREEEKQEIEEKGKKKGHPRKKRSDLSGRQQRTIAIKMKTISYDEVDSMNTSKEGQIGGRRKMEMSPSTKGLFKSRVSSAAADTVHSFMITGDTSHVFMSKKPSGIHLIQNPEIQEVEIVGDQQNEPMKVYLERKRKSQHLSASSITKLLMPKHAAEGPSRTKSTQQLSSIIKPEIVKEEPLQEAIVSSRAPKRKSVV